MESMMLQLLAALLVVLAPALAHAYIGPGAGLTAIGALIALVATVLLALLGFVWFPIKQLMRMRASRANAARKHEVSEAERG
jgi:ABC-type nickel/cobalt efflux system permease component RcnA